MPRYLTLDLGTTYFKAALFDDAGQLLHVAHEPVRIEHPQPGRWELPDDRFERHIAAALDRLRAMSDTGFDGVAAMSFATQTNSIRLLDEHDRPWGPTVLWLDERARDMQPQIDALIADMDHHALTGLPTLTWQFTPARLMRWAQTSERWGEVHRLCLISDLLALWFTGEHVTEAGACGLTGMIDIHRLAWIEPIVAATRLDRSCFARIVRAGTDIGQVRSQAAERFGLPRGCRFVVGCLDQYAGAVGAGNVAPGSISETTGTVLATVRCADAFDPTARPEVFQGPTFDAGLYYRMAFGSVSANLLEAYRNALPDRPSFAELDAAAAQTPAGAGGLAVSPDADPTDIATIFMRGGDPTIDSRPRSNGERRINRDRATAGGERVADPLSLQRGQAVRAILEAVAAALGHQVDLLCNDAAPTSIRSVGGAARSDLWRQIKADALGLPIVATTCPEPTSLGAAILAASGTTGQAVPTIASEWVHTASPNAPADERTPEGTEDTSSG